jgi:RNA polymerase sigma-70 factor (ECF subfamily)
MMPVRDNAVRESPQQDTRTDEELARMLADGQPEALTPLYNRYAPLVFHIAAQSLDTATAEDIVQEVFLSLWRKAHTYDPRRGPFRPWLLQVAHFRVLNELRTRSRRPKLDPDSGTELLDDLADGSDGPVETAWQTFRREAVQAAVERLPQAQRQALSLAFFEDLTHDQVAETLRLPLGTVKTRIRSGIRKLRFLLAPMGVAVVLLAVLLGVAVRARQGQELAQRTDRALAFVTASDITTLHLAAAPGAPARTHGSYRGRTGTALAVIALHNLDPLARGMTYRAWMLSSGTWIPVGSATPGADGNALIIAEGQALTSLPEGVEVTVEPAGGSPAPRGPVIIQYQAAGR